MSPSETDLKRAGSTIGRDQPGSGTTVLAGEGGWMRFRVMVAGVAALSSWWSVLRSPLTRRNRSGNGADGVRRAQPCRGHPGRRDRSGVGTERCRGLRSALEPGCESGLRLAYPPRASGRDRPSGSLIYQDAGPNACRDRTYTAGQGFARSVGHVSVIAGPSGAEIYSTFFLPLGSRATSSRHPRGGARSRTTHDVNSDGSRESDSIARR